MFMSNVIHGNRLRFKVEELKKLNIQLSTSNSEWEKMNWQR